MKTEQLVQVLVADRARGGRPLGRLLVTARAIHEAWTLYIQDRGTPPPPTAVSRALGGLSKEVFMRSGFGVKRYRDFDLGALALWAQETGYIDDRGIREAVAAIARDTRSSSMAPSVVN